MQKVGKSLSHLGYKNSYVPFKQFAATSCRPFHIATADLSKDLEGKHSKYFPVIKSPMLPPDTFKEKVVFITGGGTGLGKGIATNFSQLGAKVVIAARRLPVLEEAAKEITKQTGNEVFPIQLDVRDPEKVASVFDTTTKHFGIPTVIINNAAGNFVAPSERLSANAWKTVVDIVLNGTAFVTLEAGKRLIKEEKGGVVLAISTNYARTGSGFVSPSAAAKSGVENMMRSLASEWARYGLRFNCIAPGPIETEGAFSRLDPTGNFKVAAYKRIPTGRLGAVEELANLVTYIASDYASWINGETISQDGGQYVHMAGEFSQAMIDVTPEQWNELEKQIRKSNKASKK